MKSFCKFLLSFHRPREWVEAFLRKVLPEELLHGAAAAAEPPCWEDLGLEFSVEDLE